MLNNHVPRQKCIQVTEKSSSTNGLEALCIMIITKQVLISKASIRTVYNTRSNITNTRYDEENEQDCASGKVFCGNVWKMSLIAMISGFSISPTYLCGQVMT